MGDANDLRNQLAPKMPSVIDRLYEIALNKTLGKTVRRDALRQLLRRGFARPASADDDPSFKPSPMSAETRSQLQAELDALK